MKLLFTVATLLVLASCSTSTTQQTSEEPITDADSIVSDSEEQMLDIENPDSLAEAIEQGISDVDASFNKEDYYTISSHYSGYESGGDGTWYADSLLNLKYCEFSWSMEGRSGSYSYYFEGENVIAGQEENGYNDYEENVWIHAGFKPTYGFSKTNGTENDSIISFLGEADFISKNREAQGEYAKLLSRILEYKDSASYDNEHEVKIYIETIVNYGGEFTETEEYTISRVLFNKLIKD